MGEEEAIKMKMKVMLTALLEKTKARIAPPKPEGPLTCKFCQNAVDKIAELIQNCKDSLPDSPIAEDTCEMVVNTFMKDLMDLFREVMEPEHLCEIMGLCPIPDPPKSMFGYPKLL